MTPHERKTDLPAIEIFSGLSAAEKAAVAARLETLALRRGEVLVRQGDAADALYVVVSGRFAVMREGWRGPISEIGPGQPIGEIAFLTGGKRTATVTAMRDGLVLRLTREEFDELTEAHPMIWSALTVTLAHRLTEAASVLPPRPDARARTVCLIRAGGAPVPESFTRLLTGVLGAEARTLVVNSSNAADVLSGIASLDGADATRALNALESRYSHLLLIADQEVTPWTEKAIRHADLVLAAGRFGADPAPNALETLAAQFVAPDARRLVLLHDRRGRIQGTSRWLRDRDIAMHHHVALGDRGDVERLLRFINGTAVGLVACGGGAFCAAHIGVYKALAEMDVGFDIMGGTSAGSAMVAAFALGTDPDEIEESVHDMFVAHKAMRRYTWPRYSLLDHTNFDRQLKRYFDGIDIEDLWLPYFAVSTNLSRFRLNRHRIGPLWTAIRASSSIPVLLPPVYTHDGEMLVDGCLLDNVPVRTMQDIKTGPNVVVSFAIPELERFDVAYETLPSRAELVRLALNPMKREALPAAPGLIPVLLRSLMASRRDFQRDMASDDVLLVPPVPKNMGFLDWQRHRELCEGAYRWTLEEVSRLRALGRPPWIKGGGEGRPQ